MGLKDTPRRLLAPLYKTLASFTRTVIGYLPGSVEFHWRFLGGKRHYRDHYRLNAVADILIQASAAAKDAAQRAGRGRRVLIFTTLHYWVAHTALMGLALAGLGHDVTLAYLPYSDWYQPVNRFVLRRRILHTRERLLPAEPLLKPVCWLKGSLPFRLPEAIRMAVEQVSLFDTQYTLQQEIVDRKCALYRLRLKRNRAAARAALSYLRRHRPDVVIIPNGVILEFGVVYAVARQLGIRTVTFEFGEQSERMWLAQDGQIIRHDTDALWNARRDQRLTKEQRKWLKEFFAVRQTTRRGDSFARLWQETGRRGGSRIKKELGLDDRPVVLLATNVLGDSLTLGRQLLGPTMSDWIERLVNFLAGHDEIQLVIRIHPGEMINRGPSLLDVINAALPRLPDHFRVIEAQARVNTYDLMEVASLGLVYTTTSGLEMATRGLPVMVAGRTHYRRRGFTIDTDSYQEYFDVLGKVLGDLKSYQLTAGQVELAWSYAYRFFKEFPRPFPWHILHLVSDYRERPMDTVLGPQGLKKYATTFNYLAGEPLDWNAINGI